MLLTDEEIQEIMDNHPMDLSGCETGDELLEKLREHYKEYIRLTFDATVRKLMTIHNVSYAEAEMIVLKHSNFGD